MASGNGKAYANTMNWKLDLMLTPGPTSERKGRHQACISGSYDFGRPGAVAAVFNGCPIHGPSSLWNGSRRNMRHNGISIRKLPMECRYVGAIPEI